MTPAQLDEIKREVEKKPQRWDEHWLAQQVPALLDWVYEVSARLVTAEGAVAGRVAGPLAKALPIPFSAVWTCVPGCNHGMPGGRHAAECGYRLRGYDGA